MSGKSGLSVEDWSNAWENDVTPWHVSTVNSVFEKYLKSKYLHAEESKKLSCFFPLCGKSIDMLWAAKQGCLVRGSEFSQKAIDEFFFENAIETSHFGGFTNSEEDSLNISLRPGDFYLYPEDEKFEFIFDRGSMVAIDPNDREKYAEKIFNLLQDGGIVLLEAILRDESEIANGPPFHLTLEQVKSAYDQFGLKVTELETRHATQAGHGQFTLLYLQISK
ncbi:Oidioi.mRNA.OKI2018_I69.XSR.g16892.t1.cds [Oikopleura dioica]|uniref:Oidioi.mRNA.OKI2018_I69.XSR.g16892.t1.cds n=1 Tax=Oikopleura dioica TaxID=34765 RepID=A0ABN7SLF3_OIKDI|nr:Oidioi.mRNA.OKI2018_I69.XSR.g16892.t1.cds [Oikopleura dioica]